MGITYKDAGVDIDAGEALVDKSALGGAIMSGTTPLSKERVMATKTDEQQQRVPTPPTTRRQEEEFAAAQEERQGDPVAEARQAVLEAQASLRAVEDALDAL